MHIWPVPDVRKGYWEKKTGCRSLGSPLYQMPGIGRRRNVLISSLWNHVTTGFKLAELLFFPSSCKLCSNPLDSKRERVVCRDCLEGLKHRSYSYCLGCGQFFQDVSEPHFCAQCAKEKPIFSLHRSCGLYQRKLKDFILLYKYQGYQILGKNLARFMLETLGSSEEIWWGVDALVPVPLHPKRERKRGFNQALVLAKELAKAKGLSVIARSLIKREHRPPQTFVQAPERVKNIKGAFVIKREEKIKDKVLLLIDDVYTTGATASECSSVLIQAGAKEVRVLTLAQA